MIMKKYALVVGINIRFYVFCYNLSLFILEIFGEK